MRDLLASVPDGVHPVTAQIIIDGERPTAVDAFAAFYQLEDLRRQRDRVFQEIDLLLLHREQGELPGTVRRILAGLVEYLGEFTLVECYARSMLFCSWQTVLVGDPLYNPYKAAPKVKLADVVPSPKGGKNLVP